MNKTIPLLFLLVAAAVVVGCNSPSTARPQTSPAVAAGQPFRPTLITVFGTHPTSDGTWKIEVSEDSIAFAWATSGCTTGIDGWKAKAGWFIYVENQSRAWAYDGGRYIYLDTETTRGENNYFGANYIGIFRAADKFDSNFPCAVPAEVISHLPEEKQKEILANRYYITH